MPSARPLHAHLAPRNPCSLQQRFPPQSNKRLGSGYTSRPEGSDLQVRVRDRVRDRDRVRVRVKG